jgi:hypothetical protein
MHLVKDHKFDIANQIGALVQHASQDFSRHHQAARLGIDLHIPCEYSDR